MRIKRTLINSIYAIVSYGFLAVLGIVMRKFFLVYLSTDFLGYEGLFGDLFSILSVGELGIAGIIQYKLYQTIAAENKNDTAKIMTVYKILYRIVGFGILIVGIILIPLLKYIIKDNSLEWSYVYLIYALQMASALCNYFLAYKRIMIVANLREAEITKIETACTFTTYVLKILSILVFKNYILYLALGILNNIVANAIIARKVDRDYAYINADIKVSREDIRELKIGKDLKNNVVQKICMAIYAGTDNILISSLIGISYSGLLSNYSMITAQISKIMTKLLDPFQASIVNYVYAEDADKHDDMFHMFDRISFFLAAFITTSFFVLLNPFIELVYGTKFMMSTFFVFSLVCNQYIMYNHKFLCFYRGAFGRFELDKPYTATAAILNVVLSIVLAKPFGIAGIMLGTAIGHMGFWVGRARVVYSEYIKESIWTYVIRQLANLGLCVGEVALTWYIASFTDNSIVGFLLKLLLCLAIPNVCNLLIFSRTKDMKLIRIYLGKTLTLIKKRNLNENC